VATDVLIHLADVGKTFQMGEVAVEVLRNINLDIRRRELLVMVGQRAAAGGVSVRSCQGNQHRMSPDFDAPLQDFREYPE
jgi:predicted ABC-type transport system involved in lysophospholipase L1 biosynthesis ATPase subunit